MRIIFVLSMFFVFAPPSRQQEQRDRRALTSIRGSDPDYREIMNNDPIMNANVIQDTGLSHHKNILTTTFGMPTTVHLEKRRKRALERKLEVKRRKPTIIRQNTTTIRPNTTTKPLKLKLVRRMKPMPRKILIHRQSTTTTRSPRRVQYSSKSQNRRKIPMRRKIPIRRKSTTTTASTTLRVQNISTSRKSTTTTPSPPGREQYNMSKVRRMSTFWSFCAFLTLINLAHTQQIYGSSCQLPIDSGNCGVFSVLSTPTLRYAYDRASARCIQFSYSGCGGNTNRYTSYNQCLVACFSSQQLLSYNDLVNLVGFVLTGQTTINSLIV